MQTAEPSPTPIPRMLAWSGVVLAPVILIAFEPDGLRHALGHQLRSLTAVWLYVLGVLATIHVTTELVARLLVTRGRDPLRATSLALGVLASACSVFVLSVPAAPPLTAICPGIGGHETDLVLRGVLLGAVYAVVGMSLGASFRAAVAAKSAHDRAERALAESRLAALTARTQPHFVANALNTIAQALRDDPDRAERLVEDLGSLFNHALAGSTSGIVPLEAELDAVRAYLGVQAARFDARLRFTIDVEPDLRGAVPALSILPLVENAVLHGLSVGSGVVSVGIAVRQTPTHLEVEVVDDGPGPAGSRHPGHGTGLRELRERLALVFPTGGASVTLGRVDPHTVATLHFPMVRGWDGPP